MDKPSPRRLLFLLLLVLLGPAVLVSAECSTDPCPAEPDCAGCAGNELVADPENCRGYYYCVADGEASSLPFECDEGQVFNATIYQCVEGEECEPCSSTGGSCTYECIDGEEGLVSSLTDCQSYYTCTADGIEVATCEDPTPFFDGEECQADESLCCHCRPYCTDFTDTAYFIVDPKDCRGYYLCTENGEPTISGTCPDGEVFDSVLGGCSATASCVKQPTCTNVVGPDGCIDPFTCESTGYFAKCPGQCTEEYYHCTAATGEYQEAEKCATGAVFHPDSHTCVSPDACP